MQLRSLESGAMSRSSELRRLVRIDGVVVHGAQRGRQLGFPTANVCPPVASILPADGVYAGRVVVLSEAGQSGFEAVVGVSAISIGTNPTFDDVDRVVEAHVLDFDGDLYGQLLGVEFWYRLRSMTKYEGVEALIVQMGRDVARTRELFDLR